MPTTDKLPVGFEWRVFHWRNAMKIPVDKRTAAVEFLKGEIDVEQIRTLSYADPEWWVGGHFHWGMAIRNRLRSGGFGEKELGVDNLDDYYIGLVELAVGVTSEDQEPKES
jgi:hypothetical protein